MGSPRSIRLQPQTIASLAAFAARHPGMTSGGAAALLVEEGLRMASHPGVVFRDGPSGRRAGLAAGPDVWEVARAIRDTRSAEPGLEPSDMLALVSENTGLPPHALQIALDYYGEYRAEIDTWLAGADAAERQAEAALANTGHLLSA